LAGELAISLLAICPQRTTAWSIEELEAQISRQASELDAMTEKLAQQDRVPADEPDTGTVAMKSLSSERDALATENEDLKARLMAAQSELRILEQESSSLNKDLNEDLAHLQNTVVPQLTAERAKLKDRVGELEAETTDLETQINASSNKAESDAKHIAALETQLGLVQSRLADTEKLLEASKANELLQLQDDSLAINADTPTDQKVSEGNAEVTSALEPRNRTDVVQALQSATGLGSLSDAQREVLTNRLESGECVTTALEAVFDRVPILALRDLIRDLNSNC
jgi:chromosome segregation ATPase